ncbi:MAG: hypothetical protein ACYC9S_08800 [Leptospirales bacterium]
MKARPKDETVIHMEAVHSRSGEDSPVVLAGFWAVTGLVMVGLELR